MYENTWVTDEEARILKLTFVHIAMEGNAYVLQHPGSCTGMYWRIDPRGSSGGGKLSQLGGKDWPRNGSVLVGEEHQVGADKFLCVSAWRQANTTAFISDCAGLWMPFEQGGLLLHPTTI